MAKNTCKVCEANLAVDGSCPNQVNHKGLGEEPETVSYNTMKKDDLVKLAEEKGIELTGDENRADLIKLLEEKDEESGEASNESGESDKDEE